MSRAANMPHACTLLRPKRIGAARACAAQTLSGCSAPPPACTDWEAYWRATRMRCTDATRRQDPPCGHLAQRTRKRMHNCTCHHQAQAALFWPPLMCCSSAPCRPHPGHTQAERRARVRLTRGRKWRRPDGRPRAAAVHCAQDVCARKPKVGYRGLACALQAAQVAPPRWSPTRCSYALRSRCTCQKT